MEERESEQQEDGAGEGGEGRCCCCIIMGEAEGEQPPEADEVGVMGTAGRAGTT